MKTSMQFRGFEGLDHLRDFVTASMDQTIGKFESWREFDSEILLKTARGRSRGRRPLFECEVLIRGKNSFHPIFVKKSNADFYQAVHECMRVAEKLLRRSAKIRVSHRRQVRIKPFYVPQAA